jgi:chaperonin cofactor prefoldin
MFLEDCQQKLLLTEQALKDKSSEASKLKSEIDVVDVDEEIYYGEWQAQIGRNGSQEGHLEP